MNIAPKNAPVRPRMLWLDNARTTALFGMIVFHFFHDLEIFGILPRGTTVTGGWSVFSSLVAGSFLGISGVSFWLAHCRGIRWSGFLRRFVILSGAAGLVSLATYLVFPDNFIRFGILHCIAMSSLFGLMVLRLPATIVLSIAVALFLIPDQLKSDIFNANMMLWLGLSTVTPPALDYIPVLPWTGFFLIGLAVAKMLPEDAWLRFDRYLSPLGKASMYLAWPGKHSLSIYLLHQPVLLGLIWTAITITS